MAGAVQNTPCFSPASAVALKWSWYTNHTTNAPNIAPRNCARTYDNASSTPTLPAIHIANVTAGFKCPPLYGPAITTPTNTASAHAVAMTIQPPLFPLVPVKTTLATTPPPNRIRNPVPISSAINGVISEIYLKCFDVST